MSDQNINDTAYGVTKAVLESEAVSNLTNPPTKVVGGFVSRFHKLNCRWHTLCFNKSRIKAPKKVGRL